MEKKDLIVIGGGAAGLSCAQYAARASRSVVVIEEQAMGGQLLSIDSIANYPGFNQGIEGWKLAMQLEEQAREFKADLVSSSVLSIEKEDDLYKVKTSNGSEFSAPVIVFATGAKHRELGVEGEKEHTGMGVSYCATCDGPFFKGKKLLVVGGGDSAVQEALFLSKLSDDVTIIHRKDRFRAQAAIVENLEKTKVKISFNKVVNKIIGEGGKVSKVAIQDVNTKEINVEDFNGVFIFAGMLARNELAKDFCELDKAGYIKTDEKMRTSTKGIYAVGDVRSTVFRQIVTAASDGAIAAHYASEYIDELANKVYK